MAKLVFTLDEIVSLIKKKISLPDRIKNISSNKKEITATINMHKYLPNINVSVIFVSYLNEKLLLKIKTNIALEVLIKLALKFIKLPHYSWYKITGTSVSININSLLTENVEGVKIKQILFEQGNFVIETELS